MILYFLLLAGLTSLDEKRWLSHLSAKGLLEFLDEVHNLEFLGGSIGGKRSQTHLCQISNPPILGQDSSGTMEKSYKEAMHKPWLQAPVSLARFRIGC